MYDPDVMIQPGQPRPSIISSSGPMHFPSTVLPDYQRPSSFVYKSPSQSKPPPPSYPGESNDSADVGKRPPLYPNLNQDGYLNNNNNNFTNETPLKQSASIGGGDVGGSVNAAVNLSPVVDKRNSARFSQGLQSPSWTDHHYYNTHHFNSDGLPTFNYSAYYHHHQEQPIIDETHINHSFHIDPLGATPSFSTTSTGNSVSSSSVGAANAAATAAAFTSRSRLKSIAFISQISAFGLKNKRRFSHLTQKSIKVKDKVLSSSKTTTTTATVTSRNSHHGKGKHSSDGQSNPLSVAEIYGNEYEGYYNANMQSDNLDFNTMESLDNDYFLYSLQAAIFHGLIPSSQSNNNNNNNNNSNNNQYTFHDTDKFQFPYTRTSIIHEEFDPSFGEDLGLGNSRVSSTLSAYSSSNRNSKTLSPDFMNLSNASSNASNMSNARFKFPPPGPPVAGWVNQFILHSAATPENTMLTTTIPPPPSTRSERRLSHSQQQQKTSSSLINSPVNNSSVTVIDIADLSMKTSTAAAAAALVGTMKSTPGNRCISSVPPSPQHIPFQYVHSSRSLGLTSSSIIPRRHAAKKYSFQESPIISNAKNSLVNNPPKSDLLVKSNNSSIVLTNTAVNNDSGLFMLFSDNTTTNTTNNATNNDANNPTTNNNNNNTNTGNEDDEMPSQCQQSPISYTDGNYCDSGYHDSVIIAEQSLLSSLSAEHSLDLQLSPVLLISENQSKIDLLNNNNSNNNNNDDDRNNITPDDDIIPLSNNDTDNKFRNQLTEDSTHTNTASLSKSLQFTYSKLDTPKPLPISSPTSPLISSASSLSNNSTSTMASSTNSNTVMLLRDNAADLTTAHTFLFPPHIFSSMLPWDARSSCRSPFGFYWRVCLADVVAQPYTQTFNRKLYNSNLSAAAALNIPNHCLTNPSQLGYRSPSDPDVFLTFCEDSVRKSAGIRQPINHHLHHGENQPSSSSPPIPMPPPLPTSNITSTRGNFAAPNGMMKLMMMSTLSDSFKYHLTRQKSEGQLLTDRHDSFDEVLWDLQPTPLY
ncbi:unnamed protein product [Trichobilharzia szidati]|nr:unnamed protein product [Trichobilharzia szidati]